MTSSQHKFKTVVLCATKHKFRNFNVEKNNPKNFNSYLPKISIAKIM